MKKAKKQTRKPNKQVLNAVNDYVAEMSLKEFELKRAAAVIKKQLYETNIDDFKTCKELAQTFIQLLETTEQHFAALY